MHGLVRFVVIVMGGALRTLSIGISSSEVINVSTLCDEEGRAADIVLRAFAIVRIFLLRSRR